MRLLAWCGMKQPRSVAGDAVAVEHGFGGFGHLADGELVDGLAVLVDEVLLVGDGLVRGGEEAAAGGHVEGDGAGAVDLVPEVDEADSRLLRRARAGLRRRRRRRGCRWCGRCSR